MMSMTHDEKVTDKLQSDFPDLIVSSIELLGAGWNNIAYLVNGETIFRVPTDRDSTGPNRGLTQ